MCSTEEKPAEPVCPYGGCCAASGSQGTRRTFLKVVTGILTAPLVILMGWPFIQNIVGTIFRIPKAHFAKVGKMSGFPDGKPVSPKFMGPNENPYIHTEETYDVWVIKHSASKVTVFSPICPHLGCRYNWYPKADKFICPCHGSVYSITGKVLGGPAPRGLDTLPWKIEKDELYVKWERFRVGIPQKIRIG